MRLNFNEMLDSQKYWKECEGLTVQQKEGYITLSKRLMKRAIDNNGEVDKVRLCYPEDYPNYAVFREFAYAVGARVLPRKKKKGGLKMCDFGSVHEVDVE